MGGEQFHHFIGEAWSGAIVLEGEFPDDLTDEDGNVFASRAQRREVQGHGVQPIV